MQKNSDHIYGLGRRKAATALVTLIPNLDEKTNAETTFSINNSLSEEYFQGNFEYLTTIKSPLKLVNLESRYSVTAQVHGGGLRGQADALKLALARALCSLDRETFRPTLKASNFLSRDARVKERRKYGLKKARKSSQYSKR